MEKDWAMFVLGAGFLNTSKFTPLLHWNVPHRESDPWSIYLSTAYIVFGVSDMRQGHTEGLARLAPTQGDTKITKKDECSR